MGFDEDDIDQSWESWRDLFLNAVAESFIPKIKLRDAKSPKWIDSELSSYQSKSTAYGRELSSLIHQYSGTIIGRNVNK